MVTQLFVFLLVPLLGTQGIQAASTPPIPRVVNTSYSGTGCPKGTVSAFITDNGTSLVTVFDGNNMQPVISPGVDPTYKRRQCSVKTEISLDDGWRLRINAKGVDVGGDMPMDEGFSYQFAATWLVDDLETATSNATAKLDGPNYPGTFRKHGDPTSGPLDTVCERSVTLTGRYSSLLSATSTKAYTGEPDPDGGPWTVGTSIEVVECKNALW